MRGTHRLLLALALITLVVWLCLPARETAAPPSQTSPPPDAAGAAVPALEADAEEDEATAPVLSTTVRPAGEAARTSAAAPLGNRVQIQVLASGKPLANRGVRVWGTAIRPARALFRDDRTGADGTCTLLLPPGSFHVGLIPYPEESRARRTPGWKADPDDRMRTEHSQGLELAEDHAKAQVLIRVPSATLQVTVRDAQQGRGIAGATVRALRPGRLGRLGRSRSRTALTDENGVAVLHELARGAWQVKATMTGWSADPPGGATTRTLAEGESASVEMALRATGFLTIHLLDETGQRVGAPLGCLPTLRDAGGGRLRSLPRRPIVSAKADGDLEIRPVDLRPWSRWRFELSPGRYQLSVEDEQEVTPDGVAVRPHPFEPVPAREVEVRVRETTELELPVRRRTHVVLELGAPARGPPAEIAVLRVEAASGTRIRYLPTSRHVRWKGAGFRYEGYLPAGRYEVVLDRPRKKGERRTEPLAVEGEEIRRSYEIGGGR